MGFEIDGLDKLIRDTERLQKILPEKIQEAIDETIEEVFEETQIRVPKDSKALMLSGKVVPVDTEGPKRTSEITYGNSEVDRIGVYYAAAVHEILDAFHAPPTGAKYLEGPLLAAQGRFEQRLAEKIQEAMDTL